MASPRITLYVDTVSPFAYEGVYVCVYPLFKDSSFSILHIFSQYRYGRWRLVLMLYSLPYSSEVKSFRVLSQCCYFVPCGDFL